MELRELARDVYACLQPDRGLGTSNSGLLNRGGGLVVDTFWDLPHTRQMIDTYARVWKAPARRVVNTHRNGDHCWGNQLFPDAEIIGHRLCAAEFGKERPEFMQTLRNSGSSSDPALAAFARRLADWDFAGIELRPPQTLVDERLTIDLDGIQAHLIYVGPAHTSGDLIVHLPAERIVFTGDILFRLCTPSGWEGTYDRWIAALDRIVALAAADAGLGGLEFLSGVPGSIGGSLRMNAGAYGREIKDVLVSAFALDRTGETHTVDSRGMGLSYRHSDADPSDYLPTRAATGRSGSKSRPP